MGVSDSNLTDGNAASIEGLLARLSGGDDEAVEQVFRAYEPYLRKVVRRLLPAESRAKFDSVDVVQSMCGDVLVAFREGGLRFHSADQLRAFLVKATRNRFIDRVRRHRTALRMELPAGEIDADRLAAKAQPRPSEFAQADELWERMLARCPPEHRPILHLRRRGATTAEIAAEIGLHEGSVRRVLRELSLRVACGRQTTRRDDSP
jgi:RNA polymerase sigma-70 factor (ECF subfamily)